MSRLCPNIALSLPSCCLVIPMPWKRKRNWAADACCYHNAHHNSMDVCDQEIALPRGAGSNRRQGRRRYHAVPTTFSSARDYLRPLLGRTLLFPAAPHQKFPVQNRLAVSERHCSRRELTTNSRCSDCVQNTSGERPRRGNRQKVSGGRAMNSRQTLDRSSRVSTPRNNFCSMPVSAPAMPPKKLAVQSRLVISESKCKRRMRYLADSSSLPTQDAVTAHKSPQGSALRRARPCRLQNQ